MRKQVLAGRSLPQILIPILWFWVPGYGIALPISFFVPRIHTAIVFDSGSVDSPRSA